MTKAFVVIPAYNEEKKISSVVRKAKNMVSDVVVVDDGSKDNTPMLAREAGAKVLSHVVNMGKGASLKTGCDFAILNGARRIVVLDADGQHDPKEIPKFLKTLEKNDIVFGYRQIGGPMPAILKFGNWFINASTKFLYGIDLKDTQSGYRAFTREAYRQIRWEATDYSMESEMIANVGKNSLRYDEIPIQTIYTDKYKGTTVIDGMKIVLRLLWWKVTR